VTCGVPQGSILGPLLCLIYVNDLVNSVPCLQVVMFADDTNVFYSHENIYTLFSRLNEQLKLISAWFQANRLAMNVKKNKIYGFWK
jgi:hypothetical protein